MKYKTVSFNIFEEHLEDIVYKDRNNKSPRSNETDEQDKFSGQESPPAPKPSTEYWHPSFQTRKI